MECWERCHTTRNIPRFPMCESSGLFLRWMKFSDVCFANQQLVHLCLGDAWVHARVFQSTVSDCFLLVQLRHIKNLWILKSIWGSMFFSSAANCPAPNPRWSRCSCQTCPALLKITFGGRRRDKWVFRQKEFHQFCYVPFVRDNRLAQSYQRWKHWIECARLYIVKDNGACLLVVHVCRTVDRVVGHTRPSLAGIGVPWVSLPGPTDVPCCTKWHQNKAPTFFLWLLECGFVDVSCARFQTCSTWLHWIALVRVLCPTTTLDSWSSESEHTYTECFSFFLNIFQIDPILCVLVHFPSGPVKYHSWFCHIFKFILFWFVHWTHGCEEYRLPSFFRIFSFCNQTWLDKRIAIMRRTDVTDVLNNFVRDFHVILKWKINIVHPEWPWIA